MTRRVARAEFGDPPSASSPAAGRNPLRVQLPRFAAVGVVNTGVDLAILNALTILTGFKDGAGYAVLKTLSFCAAVVVSFLLNKRWTFGDPSRTGRGRKLAKFFAVSLFGAALNVSAATFVATVVKAQLAGVLPSLLATDQFWVNAGALSGTALGLVWNFLGYRRLVFRA